MSRLLLNCAIEGHLMAFVGRELNLDVVIARDDRAALTAVKAQTVHVMLRDSGESAVRDLAFARELRQQGYLKPIVMLTERMGEGLISAPGLSFVEKPYELEALARVLRKVLSTPTVPQQVFRRYDVNLPVRLETFISGDTFESKMFNLSRGGAYFEVGRKTGLRTGDLLRLKVWLSDVEREHTLSGRVMWTTSKGRAAGGYGIGLKFMTNSDIYHRLRSAP